jgi:hypothetical protein
MISSPMLERLRDKGFGALIQLNNNADLIQEIKQGNATITQSIVDEWDESLSSMGGRLVADKCRYFVVKHKWEHNRWHIIKTVDPAFQLSIKDDQGFRQKIPQECNHKGELALGIMFAPNGNMVD